MKFNKPINREVEIDNNTYVVTMDDSGVSFRVKGKRKSMRAEWPAILFIARAEATETGGHQESAHQESAHHEYGHGEHKEEAAAGTIGRSASAGDRTPES
ncbi:MAG TPA: hypothetical protein VKJ45_10535 [Blastocatellia bacterium]|nr:hypothetical protein [Blastocatellia bacterium]